MIRRNRNGTYFPMMGRGRIIASVSFLPLAFLLMLLVGWVPKAQAAPTLSNLIGEIERITIDNPADHYSGGKIVVGGQVVTLPRNLLIDLPANRLTLKQLFELAPAACIANGETGLAKADACNQSGMGAFATMSANRSDFGNVIAGDVLIDKGLESVTGFVTFINYDQGYYRVGGQPGVDNAGVIVRLNDPGARHTVQSGLGCLAGSENCSADPRFTLDPDNYTNVFSNGFPYCLPSTVARTVTTGLPAIPPSIPAVPVGPATPASADGTGDVLCPDTNRPASLNTPAADSRRLAPLKVGDSITAEGTFEIIDGVKFLSAHTSIIGVALPSATTAGQPDYFFLAEVFMDAPAFFNLRYRTLIIGYTTLADPAVGGTDVLFWTIHRDKVNNEIHELPWASVLGCDAASGAGTCSSQGLAGAGGFIFRIRHDIDFLMAANPATPGGTKDGKLSLCAHLRGDPGNRLGTNICPTNPVGNNTGTLAEEFGIFSPIPHEIMGRTGRKVADVDNTIKTIDVSGNEATWGEYLFPFGVNLGGISLQEMNEIDLNLMSTPNLFEGIPWNLDRRLGPGGCPETGCEADDPADPYKYALDPFPYSGLHPKTALVTLGIAPPGGLPTDPYNDPNFTASPLDNVQNRMFSFVNAAGAFDGNNTVINSTQLANLTPPDFPIVETPPLQLAITVLPPPAVNALSPLTASPASPQLAGPQVLFTTLASGGSGIYEYQFSQNIGGVLTIMQPYGPSPSWVWSTAGLAAGTYNFQVDARSAFSANTSEASAVASYVIVSPAPATGAFLFATPASSQPQGTPVTFIAVGAGGSLIYEYQFSYRLSGTPTYTLGQAYSSSSIWNWTTTAIPSASYNILVNVRSAGSTAASEASATATFSFTGTGPASGVALNPTPASPQVPGTSVLFTAAASGGSESYEYQFWLHNGTSWSIMKPYGAAGDNNWSWSTSGVADGTYYIQVWARSAGSTAPYDARAEATYILSAVTPAATVTFTPPPSPASPQAPGTRTPVLFTAVAGGGSGSYEYQFWLFNGTSWSIMKPYGAADDNTWTWTTSGVTAGTYFIQVWARGAGSANPYEARAEATYVLQ